VAKDNNRRGLILENKVFGKWIAMAAVLDKFTLRAAQDCFGQIRRKMVAAVRTTCGEDAQGLSAYDVQIYEAYRRIISAYEEVANIHFDATNASPGLKNIWEGVYSVLSSRITTDFEG
jgi:hypothetical protein